MKLSIPVLLGTLRDDAISDRAAAYVHKRLTLRGVESTFVDPEDYHEKKTFEAEHIQPWSDIMEHADGLIIVSPEYNHGYPGPLKEMLDALYNEYARKPVAICGVSSGGLGGARAVEQLRLVSITLKLHPIEQAVYFSNCRDLFLTDGSIKDATYDTKLDSMFDELFWYAHVLKAGRENRIDIGL